MPLPNDEWSKGKCGFKGLQYMALEIPSILSPVGVNSEIITHGINGYLASTQAEWEHYLTILIQDAELRKRIGIAGRKTIENYYSIESQKQRYISIFRNLLPK
jgi:glycosyltransferase involved in cell wall biosynthesis